MRGNQVHPVLLQVGIEPIAVIGTIANQIIRLRLDHVELEAELHQGDLVVVRRMGADRQRQPMTIHNCHDFHALATLGRANFFTAAFGRGKRCIDEAFRFIDRTLIAEGVGKINKHIAQDIVAAPVLKAAMHGFVVRVALRQHVPLSTGVENPKDGFDDVSGSNRLASRSAGRDVFLRKMIPDTIPVFIA